MSDLDHFSLLGEFPKIKLITACSTAGTLSGILPSVGKANVGFLCSHHRKHDALHRAFKIKGPSVEVPGPP